MHLKFSYRRRVTLADLRPMNVIISANERPISFIDEFDNVGNGILTISVDGHNVLVSKEGRLKAKCNDTVVGPFVECPLGSEITIGSLKLKVE